MQPATSVSEPPARHGQADADTVDQALDTLQGKSQKGQLARILPFLGPAFIASAAFVDPGNFATDIQSGAQFGYTLLWVVLASNLMAMLIQALSAKLGIASGMSLADHLRERYPPWATWAMWVLMELVALATDLAEFLGAALGFHLLFGVSLWIGGLFAGLATFLILGLERQGFRPIEAVITGLVGVIALCYLVETALDRPAWDQVVLHAVVPGFAGAESVLLAAGILGATVMPHTVFLHSALTQSRIVTRNPQQLRRLFRFEVLDVSLAMVVASIVNMAMLIMAATFHARGIQSVGSLQEAHETLAPLFGPAADAVFAIALLASGLSSSSVSMMSGQSVMQGLLHRRVPIWARRLFTMLPSLAVIALSLDPTRTLVMSQVLLSFALPFAIIPLIVFTSRKDIMGCLVNRRTTALLAGLVAALVVLINLVLIYQAATPA